jgi:hypothetical protein
MSATVEPRPAPSVPATTTTGALGGLWRADITTSGAIETAEPSGGLRYWIAADDRWHDPALETSVRQRRIDGTPVTETRVRVPNGDVVQRIWTVPDAGGVTLVEFENDSTLPVAVALDRRDLLTDRAPADVPIEGITLPAGSIVLPLGHRARVRVGLAHDRRVGGRAPSSLPDHEAVVRGWRAVLDRAGRLDLPAGSAGSGAAEAVSAQRAEWLLLGPPSATDDPVGFLIALDSLVRCGEPPAPWLDELVSAVAGCDGIGTSDAVDALTAAGRVLCRAGERRAERDLDRLVERVGSDQRSSNAPDTVGHPGLALTRFERRFVAPGDDGADLLSEGLPDDWLGQPVEIHGLPAGRGTTVSYALRWHGEHPAVIWEQDGPPVTLRSPELDPSWSSAEPTGEHLWRRPSGT